MNCYRGLLPILTTLALVGCAETPDAELVHEAPAVDAVRAQRPFSAPRWWHHYHANSQNADRIAQLPSVPRLREAWRWRTRTAAFNGAAMSRDQKTIYVTASEDDRANFYALDAETGRVRWTYDAVSAWATFSSALVDGDDTIYLSDDQRVYAIQPPRSGRGSPVELWRLPHDAVSMSLGFTPDGALFEVTQAGTVNVISRAGRLLASAALPGSRYLPPGVGLVAEVLDNERLASDAANDPTATCLVRAAPDGSRFVVRESVNLLWRRIRAQGLISAQDGLAEAFLDTAFGGVFVSNTPSVAPVGGGIARIVVPSIGEYVPPVLANRDEIASICPGFHPELPRVYPVFGAEHDDPSLHLRRGYYRGYLHFVDWNPASHTLTVQSEPLSGPSGTSPAISTAARDGQRLVFVAGGTKLDAWGLDSRSKRWTWDAELEVGGSPTIYRGADLGVTGSRDPAVAVLAGFDGVVTLLDTPAGDGDERCGGRCRVIWKANIVSGLRSRLWASLATSVAEAGREHTYVQFTSGPRLPGNVAGTYKGYMPLNSRLAVIENRTGEIVQTLPMEEAQVCDSTIGLDGSVYTIHTSGLDQLKHALYPELFDAPLGGVVAFQPAR